MDGGAINYSAHTANKLGLKVAIVTSLAKEDQRVVDKFIDSNTDCFATYTPSSTMMWLEYPANDSNFRDLSVASKAGSINAINVDHIRIKAAVIGSSFRGELGLDVFQILKKKNVLRAADMQGFVPILRDQSLVYEFWGEMDETLSILTYSKVT